MNLYAKLRLAAALILVGILGLGLFYVGYLHEQLADQHIMYDYYRANFYEETGTHNAVVAILLTYRMYDTIFEAVILLCSVIGIMHFLPAVEKHQKKKDDSKNV